MTNTVVKSASGIRQRLQQLIESTPVTRLIVSLIILNAIILGFETSTTVMGLAGHYLILADKVILAVFVVELAVRLFVYRWQFWKDPWSVFDFLVVAVALVPAAGPFSVLRALRVLRVLRLLTIVPSMRRVVGALLAAIPGLGSIALVLLIIYYVFAVIATNLFAAAYPEWFGTLGRSLYTLFQIMTLESWSMGISRPVMEEFPYAWAFFIPFILVATFTMLNLFIAIIVNAMQNYSETEHRETRAALQESQTIAETDIHKHLALLQSEIADMKSMLAELHQQRDTSSG